jgi:TetR/AcrR family fatty acid metabolism transcriptional regulator
MSNITDEYHTKERRRRAKGEATRTRLLASAAEAFAAHGYHETKVSDIVRAAKLTQPTFYLYFASKEAIFAELIDTFQARLRRLVQEAGQAGQPDRDSFRAHIQANLEAVYRLLDEQRDLTRLVLHMPEAAAFGAELVALMEQQLRLGQAIGVVRPSLDLPLTANLLIGMVINLAQRWLLSGEKGPAELAAAHTELVLNGIVL